MYKKSITRIENENESSQADLSNPALHDIIATNHVVLAKKPRDGRLSRACKALIIMIILALVATGIIVLTLVLAHSRNTLMAIISRSAEENFLSTSNNSRFLFINQENFTTVTNEKQTDNENRSTTTTTTVSLTSNNLPTLTTSNIHISSLIMRTKQDYEHISLTTQSQSMKPYPSLNTIVDDQSTMLTTIQTTVSNQQTTFEPSSPQPTTIITENPFVTTMATEEEIETSSVVDLLTSTSTLIPEETTSVSEETSFTSYISRHFNLQSSTMFNHHSKTEPTWERKFPKDLIDEDVMDDVLFS